MGGPREGIGMRAEADVATERRTPLDGLLRLEATATIVRGPAREAADEAAER